MALALWADLGVRLVRGGDEGRSARTAAAPAQIGDYRKPLLADHDDLPRGLTATRKGITPAGIGEELQARGIKPGCLRTIWTRLRHLGLSRKKR